MCSMDSDVKVLKCNGEALNGYGKALNSDGTAIISVEEALKVFMKR